MRNQKFEYVRIYVFFLKRIFERHFLAILTALMPAGPHPIQYPSSHLVCRLLLEKKKEHTPLDLCNITSSHITSLSEHNDTTCYSCVPKTPTNNATDTGNNPPQQAVSRTHSGGKLSTGL